MHILDYHRPWWQPLQVISLDLVAERYGLTADEARRVELTLAGQHRQLASGAIRYFAADIEGAIGQTRWQAA